ncbi:MAG: hypothetical protein ABS939_00315 [Psychrobacillus sp.]
MLKKVIGIFVTLIAITVITAGISNYTDCEEVLNEPLQHTEDAIKESINKPPTKVELLTAEGKDLFNGLSCSKIAVESLRVK